MTRSRDAILQELAREHARLAELARTRDEVRARIKLLRSELAAVPPTVAMPHRLPLAVDRHAIHTPAEKVNLFRSLFRGRVDIFPIRFVSKKTGKPGYAPACSNKWEPGLCLLKSGGKCSECLNQAFVPVADQVVIDHLQGRHVMGAYPLLEDETCWVLAADFDKRSWKEDVTTVTETCRSVGVPVVIERSRSGNGAHAWFFFAEPVSANVARRMGCGFGNLIALPLQYEPRQHGNSVFIDERFEPFADQWALLASVKRIEAATAEAIARDATRIGQVVGVRFTEPIDNEQAAPWTRLSSGHTRPKRIVGPLPNHVKAVLAQRLFIEKTGLPAPLLNQLRRLAAFQNPEFYKKQRMRLSTATTPRVITCAEDLAQHIALPRGCVFETEQLLEEHGVALTIDDKRHSGASLELQFNGELTAIQKEAACALLGSRSLSNGWRN